MKNILFILILLSSLTGLSQEQILNGISLNGPNGFVKAGNLHWKNGYENVWIKSYEASYTYFKEIKSRHKSACKKGSSGSGTTFVNFVNLKFSGETYGFCLNKGQNRLELDIVQTYVYRDGYFYMVTVTAEPNDYHRSFEIIGYMINRINVF